MWGIALSSENKQKVSTVSTVEREGPSSEHCPDYKFGEWMETVSSSVETYNSRGYISIIN